MGLQTPTVIAEVVGNLYFDPLRCGSLIGLISSVGHERAWPRRWKIAVHTPGKLNVRNTNETNTSCVPVSLENDTFPLCAFVVNNNSDCIKGFTTRQCLHDSVLYSKDSAWLTDTFSYLFICIFYLHKIHLNNYRNTVHVQYVCKNPRKIKEPTVSTIDKKIERVV